MLETGVRVTVDRSELRVGESVRSILSWHHDSQPAAVLLELRWFTEGRGDTDSGIVDSRRFDGGQGPIPPQVEVQLTVPQMGPASYDGELIRIRWEVRGTLEVRWRRNPRDAAPLVVLPALLSG